ncbi:MerR family transcriptional regulator [Deinococcus navajonensis]|uniref:MerR family transcriptional regulator n=1 Tax=Deinococcus navajonensis TaxID=309884 RepID=A0ABV8XIV2_9DEIO
MRIGEVAKKAGVSVRAVRHYENLGLLRAARAENRYRMFTDEDVQRIHLIQRFLSVGFRLEEIRKYGPCWQEGYSSAAPVPAEDFRVFFQRKVAMLDSQISALQQLRDRLSEKLQDTPAAQH